MGCLFFNGPNFGTNLNLADDGFSLQPIGFSFPFYGVNYTSVFINSNGNITFNMGSTTFTPTLPLFMSEQPRIAPYWIDLDSRCNPPTNNVYVTTQSGAFIITWFQIAYYLCMFNPPINTFQLVLYPTGCISFSYLLLDNTLPAGDTTPSFPLIGISPGNNLPGAKIFLYNANTNPVQVGGFTSPLGPLNNLNQQITWIRTSSINYDFGLIACAQSPCCALIFTTAQPPNTIVGNTMNDQATLSGSCSPTGTITFSLYGPNDNTCALAAIFSEVVPVNGNGVYTTTLGFTPITSGTYQWIASYSGDDNNAPISTLCGDEPVVISAATPTLTTLTQPPNTIVGNAVNDQATLSSGFNPTGTITFFLYGSDDTTCSLVTIFSEVVPVNGNGVYTTTLGFTPTTPGTYQWIAAYSGDDNNAPISTLCGDEPVVISAATPTLTTLTQPPNTIVGNAINDQATLSSGFNPTGTITFFLYGSDDTTCSLVPIFSEVVPVNGNGVYTTTLGFTPTTPGIYQWTASYSGDANNTPASTLCGSDPVEITTAALSAPFGIDVIRVNGVYDWVITSQTNSITFRFPQLLEEEITLSGKLSSTEDR